MEPSIEYVVTVLGVLKADAIFMPLNIRYPNHRMEAILRKTEPSMLVSDRGLSADLSDRMKVLGLPFDLIQPDNIDEKLYFWANMDVYPEGLTAVRDRLGENHCSEDEVKDACYIMTTSGSTGEPKVILGCHKGLCHFIRWEVNEFKLTERVRVSFLSPATFDVSLRDMFVPLVSGGTLCIPEEGTKQDPTALYQWFVVNRITLTHIVPTLFRLLTHAIQSLKPTSGILGALEYVLIAGETLYGNDVINWRNTVGEQSILVNIYGPSETTLAKLFYGIKAADLSSGDIIPLGRPIPGAEVLVINNGRLCGIGDVGEIHIRTPYKSKGYYRDPELTRSVFIQNPLEDEKEDIIYKTGDLGKWLPDNNLLFVGRTDGQIKLHGKRVEINEIEVVLNQYPGIKMAAVSVKMDPLNTPRLVAYIVSKDGQEIAVEPLRRFVIDKLPDYMVPSLFVFLEALPLTHNGKVDRQSLPEPKMTRPHLEQTYVSASHPAEKLLVDLWRQVLGFDRIGIDDNFFDLGGSSILAARLVPLIKQTFGVEVPVVKMFQFPKIRLLAKYLNQKDFASKGSGDVVDRARRRNAARMMQRRARGED
jgi:amino acid adenylation domain-containing protein